jgi:hypothetical protein
MAKISLSSKKYNPKGYTSSTSKAMKESGAKYSTTDRSGNTNFYASGKDVDAGIAPIKKTDAQGNAITSDMLKPTPGLNLPPAPQTPNVGGMVTANNAGLANSAYNITTDGKGMLQVATPTTTDNKDTSGAGFDSIFKSYLAESQNIQPVSSADIYAKEYKQQKIAQKQQDVSNYASQLNTIVANRDANLLRVEGQGRGIPEVIIGGQQAQINKEAAIAALPVQAQLAAAQDNLALANQHLTTMVNLKTQDATNQYNYKTKLLDSVYQFATAQEQRRLDQLKVENDRAYQEKQDFIKTQNAALAQALGQGAPSSVYSAIAAATDTKSVITAAGVYNGDVLGRQIQQAQLSKLNQDIAATIEAGKPIVVQNDPNLSSVENNNATLAQLFKTQKVSAGNRTTIANGLALSQAASDLAAASADGKFKGLYPGRKVVDFFLPKFLKRSSTVENESLISALDLQTQFWASGAALSDAQTELVQKMIPTKSDSDSTIRTKTNQLVNYMLSQTSSRLLTDGIEYKPLKVDLFETQTLFSKASPEQLEELKAQGLIQ